MWGISRASTVGVAVGVAVKVCVCGSRSMALDDGDLDWLNHQVAIHQISLIIHGACPTGVDWHAGKWAKDRGIPIKAFPADWKKFGRAAGPIRNRLMAVECDMLIAFPGGTGTWNMISEARAISKPVLFREPERAV